MDAKFRSSLTGWFWLTVSHEGAIQMSVGVAEIQGLTGAGGPSSRMAHSSAWQVGVGCWQETSVPWCGEPLHRTP